MIARAGVSRSLYWVEYEYNMSRKANKRYGPRGPTRMGGPTVRHPFVLPKFRRKPAPQGTANTPLQAIPEVFGTDLRAMGPLHVCSCGSQVFNAMVSFEDYELSWYFLNGSCVSCGNLVQLPCPVDNPNNI